MKTKRNILQQQLVKTVKESYPVAEDFESELPAVVTHLMQNSKDQAPFITQECQKALVEQIIATRWNN